MIKSISFIVLTHFINTFLQCAHIL